MPLLSITEKWLFYFVLSYASLYYVTNEESASAVNPLITEITDDSCNSQQKKTYLPAIQHLAVVEKEMHRIQKDKGKVQCKSTMRVLYIVEAVSKRHISGLSNIEQ